MRSHDPKRLTAWYAEHLGMTVHPWGVKFDWTDGVLKGKGSTAWSVFPENTKYFSPSDGKEAKPKNEKHAPALAPTMPQQVMIVYRVDDLDALLKRLAEAGVWIDPKRDDSEYGKFAWIQDCDGNRVELWQPLG